MYYIVKTTKMKCSKCPKKIKGKIAYLNGKPVCQGCYEKKNSRIQPSWLDRWVNHGKT